MEITGGFLFLLSLVFIGTKSDDEVCYIPKITESVTSCDSFDNDVLDCTGLKLGSSQNEGERVGKLGGKIKTSFEITSDYDIEVDIWKQMDVGDEYMYNTRMNFCASLDNADAPWAPVVESLNISGCPVPSTVFEVAELGISLDCVKDIMCHEFCGEYRIELSFVDKTEKASCHVIEICIVEEECDEK